MSNDDDTHDHYKVGYRKPPKHSRFRRGKSGNPSGVKRPVAYEESHCPVRAYMMEPVKVIRKGKAESLTRFEVMLMQLGAKAQTGDIAAIKLLLKYTDDLRAFRAEVKDQMTKAKMALIEDFLKDTESYSAESKDRDEDSKN